MHRKEIISALIDKSGRGLEIGPSHDPVAPKSGGLDVHVVDHLSQHELRAKYTDQRVNLENIEPVDFVWKGGSLADLLADNGGYDWIIASHVIEHVPDMVSFLRDCQQVLRPGGILSLAVPDQRYCFDYLRPPSTTGDVLQAFLERRTRHSAGQVFDSFALAGRVDDLISWNRTTQGRLEFLHDQGFAALQLRHYLESNDYVDVHGWVFTPHSFRLIVHDLTDLGYVRLDELAFIPTIGSEFFVSYSNAAPQARLDRIALAKEAQA